MVEQQRHMTEIHEQVRKHLQLSAEMQQRGQIQGGLKMREFKVGEQVWWYLPPTATDVAKDRNTARIRGYRRDSWVHASSIKSVIKTQDGKLL